MAETGEMAEAALLSSETDSESSADSLGQWTTLTARPPFAVARKMCGAALSFRRALLVVFTLVQIFAILTLYPELHDEWFTWALVGLLVSLVIFNVLETLFSFDLGGPRRWLVGLILNAAILVPYATLSFRCAVGILAAVSTLVCVQQVVGRFVMHRPGKNQSFVVTTCYQDIEKPFMSKACPVFVCQVLLFNFALLDMSDRFAAKPRERARIVEVVGYLLWPASGMSLEERHRVGGILREGFSLTGQQWVFWLAARVIQEVADLTQYGSEDMLEEFPFFMFLWRLRAGARLQIDNGEVCEVPSKARLGFRMFASWTTNCFIREFLHYLLPVLLMNADCYLDFIKDAFAIAFVASA